MKKLKLFLITFLCLSGVSYGQSGGSFLRETEKNARHKIIMQLTSGDTAVHRVLLNQLRNLTEVWGDSAEIEVLVQGHATDMVLQTKSTQKENIEKMRQKGVHFAICEYSMKQRNISKEEILPKLEFVKYGLIEIITKQEQGWSYLKAGF